MKARNWIFYSENLDGTINEEGERFTTKPGANKLWKSLQELLDNDTNIQAVGYKLAEGEPIGGITACRSTRA